MQNNSKPNLVFISTQLPQKKIMFIINKCIWTNEDSKREVEKKIISFPSIE